jgi:uncharacterized protein YndB with AHSA1/START domain
MTANDKYEPSPLADVAVRPAAEAQKWTIVFVRELRHAPEKVWAALTDPAQLRQWAPFDAGRNLDGTGRAQITMAGGPPDTKPEDIEVRVADAPKLLEYTWGTDLLRWELQATADGTRLTLHHTIADKSFAPRNAAGWHICLDVADRLLQGRPVGRIVADDARRHGWERLNDAYGERLGIASAGYPKDHAGRAPDQR